MMRSRKYIAAGSFSRFPLGILLAPRRGRLTIGLIAAFAILASAVQGQTPSPLTIQPSTGRVGIGTTTPTSPLTVNGTIESTSGGIKFPDGTTQNTALGGGVPAGAILFFAAASCPTGWSEYTAARGRFIVALNTGGTVAAAVGTALSDLENRSVGAHTHDRPASGDYYGINRNVAQYIFQGQGDQTPGTYIPTTGGVTGGAVAGTNAPYIQLLVCKKD
jgi:hypothetical protein